MRAEERFLEIKFIKGTLDEGKLNISSLVKNQGFITSLK